MAREILSGKSEEYCSIRKGGLHNIDDLRAAVSRETSAAVCKGHRCVFTGMKSFGNAPFS